MDRFHELHAVMTWEGYATLNTEIPRQRDIIIQHWYTVGEEDENGHRRSNFYMVYIWAKGDGWNVFKEVESTGSIEATLKAIV